MTKKDIIEAVTTIAILGAAIYKFGVFSDRLEQLENRVEKVEARSTPGTKLGDVCLSLFDAQAKLRDDRNLQRVESQLTRLGCYDRMAASSTSMRVNQGTQNAVQNDSK